MGPFGLTGGPSITHISFWVLGFLLGLLRWFIENSGVAGWQAAFGPQVSGLASDFGKLLEREVLGKERHGCSHLPWANLPVSFPGWFILCPDGTWVWHCWALLQVMTDAASVQSFIELLKQSHRAQLVQIYRLGEQRWRDVTLPESLDWQPSAAALVLNHCVVFLWQGAAVRVYEIPCRSSE